MMTPILTLKDAESRFVKGDDGLREYLRTEYHDPDSAWVIAEGKSVDRHDVVNRRRPRLRSLISRALRGWSSHGEEAGS